MDGDTIEPTVKYLEPDYVAEGMRLGQGATFCGFPMEDFTRDELFAVAVFGWNRACRYTLTEQVDNFFRRQN